MHGDLGLGTSPHGFNVTVELPAPGGGTPLQPVEVQPVPQQGTPGLAFTGADAALLLGIALVLVLAGLTLVRLARHSLGGRGT